MAEKKKKPKPAKPPQTVAPHSVAAGTVVIPTPAEVVALRKKLGLTQEEAAARIGMSRRTWQDYERGQIEITTSAAILIRLLEAGQL